MVTATPEGGFLMGNPKAEVKLVELGSMTCPHCAEFSELADKKLIGEYVKSGRVSFEFRNFVRDGLDMTASLIARCGGTERFFPLTHALFADQRNWGGHLQDVPPEQLQALQTVIGSIEKRLVVQHRANVASKRLDGMRLRRCVEELQG